MSGRNPLTTFSCPALALAALIFVSARTDGANPNTAVRQEKAKSSATTPTPNKAKATAAHAPATLTRQMPLREALDVLRNSTTPPLNLVVLWRSLHSAGIYESTPIGIDGVPGLRAGQYLDLLTLSLSAGASAKIGYVIDKGVITIATTDILPTPKPVVRLYDISDLVASPARYAPATTGFPMGYGVPTPSLGGSAQNPGSGSYPLRGDVFHPTPNSRNARAYSRR